MPSTCGVFPACPRTADSKQVARQCYFFAPNTPTLTIFITPKSPQKNNQPTPHLSPPHFFVFPPSKSTISPPNFHFPPPKPPIPYHHHHHPKTYPHFKTHPQIFLALRAGASDAALRARPPAVRLRRSPPGPASGQRLRRAPPAALRAEDRRGAVHDHRTLLLLSETSSR